jgi:hypothetical protein
VVWHDRCVTLQQCQSYEVIRLLYFFTSLLLYFLTAWLLSFDLSLLSPNISILHLCNLSNIPTSISSIITLNPRPPFLSYTMSTEWSLDFCLVCDRQTLGAPYCSQTCRLAELDEVSDGMSRRSSAASTHWSEINQAQARAEALKADTHNPSRTLSVSSSQTSLSSLKSNTSTSSNVADRLQDELRDYASCFDQVRDLKRRMTTT